MDIVRVRMNSKNEAEMIFERSRQWHGPRRSATKARARTATVTGRKDGQNFSRVDDATKTNAARSVLAGALACAVHAQSFVAVLGLPR